MSDALSQWEKEDGKRTLLLNKDIQIKIHHRNHQLSRNIKIQNKLNHLTLKDRTRVQVCPTQHWMLDEYSEDAKKTQSNYKQNKDASHKASTNSKSSHNENPQLPTNDELKHKSKPVQSFEDNVKQNNTRSTSLFQQIPQLEDGQVEEDNFNVVDSQDTRQFIKSIAKHAHKIGQKYLCFSYDGTSDFRI